MSKVKRVTIVENKIEGYSIRELKFLVFTYKSQRHPRKIQTEEED
jgi:hypothetical protein